MKREMSTYSGAMRIIYVECEAKGVNMGLMRYCICDKRDV